MDGLIHRLFSIAARGFASLSISTGAPMKLSSLFATAAVASLLLAGPAFAQTAAPATKSETAAAKMTKPHSAASIECSKEADAKGLHGKARKKFRAECKRNAMAGEKAK
jgi:hypothetical protein